MKLVGVGQSVVVVSVVSVLISLMGQCCGVSLQEDLALTKKQKASLDEFKGMMKNRLPNDYMNEDLYLIRFLRAKNFRLKEAESMLMQNVAWRKENKMDEVLNEDWSDFRKKYKYWIDGVDKDGRPIVFIDVGEWDLRKAVVSGESARVGRYIDKIYEEITTKVRHMRMVEGKNVTQYYLIFDMDGFNLVQQGCPGCLPLTTRVVTTYENYYPGNNHKTAIINTPGTFQSLLQILKPLMSPMTRNALTVYGQKGEGQAALLNDIDADQLATELGGTRDVPNYSS